MNILRCAAVLGVFLASIVAAVAAPGEVLAEQKINELDGGFTGELDGLDLFGIAVASPGDLDGDGLPELVVGARGDDDGNVASGAIWILFLNADGTVRAHQKISQTEGGFGGELTSLNFFGHAVASVGDLDRDGSGDLAVGAYLDRGQGGSGRGAVWILFLNPDGTVKAEQKIGDQAGGFTGILEDGDGFGFSVARLADLDGDGTTELAVGALGDDDGGDGFGAVYLLYLTPQGTVREHQKISATEGGFDGLPGDASGFGQAAASPGDLDGDGIADLAVSASDVLTGQGTVWVLFLAADGTVQEYEVIGLGQGGFTGELDLFDNFGVSLGAVGDLDGDGVRDLAVGAMRDDDGVEDAGAFWILFLNQQGTVRAEQKVSATQGGLIGPLEIADRFGGSIAAIGDLDGDGVTEIAAGAAGDLDVGAAWVLFMDGVPVQPDDPDGDGVLDPNDVCPETSAPESVPTNNLGVNRWALVDDDGVFDTTPSPGGGGGPDFGFTVEDTRGCSCEQIIEAMALGWGHTRFGCSTGAMLQWIAMAWNNERAQPESESQADTGGLKTVGGVDDSVVFGTHSTSATEVQRSALRPRRRPTKSSRTD
jgi:hypothetical protein